MDFYEKVQQYIRFINLKELAIKKYIQDTGIDNGAQMYPADIFVISGTGQNISIKVLPPDQDIKQSEVIITNIDDWNLIYNGDKEKAGEFPDYMSIKKDGLEIFAAQLKSQIDTKKYISLEDFGIMYKTLQDRHDRLYAALPNAFKV